MAKLRLTKTETENLLKNGSVELSRGDLDILVEWNNIEEKYDIYVINPFDKVVLNKEAKEGQN